MSPAPSSHRPQPILTVPSSRDPLHSPVSSPADDDECDSDDGDSLQTPLQDALSAPLLPSFASSPPAPFSPAIHPTDENHHAKHPFSPTHPDFGKHGLPTSFSAPAALGKPAIDATGLNLRLPIDISSSSVHESALFSPASSSGSNSPRPASPVYGSTYSPRFPPGHALDPDFARWYRLADELGAGGYGFVMTATHRLADHEVAVKFIIKDKVPEHAWMEDAHGKAVPTEALLLGLLDHPNIVRCLDLYEDELYFYLVQELHGVPWVAKSKLPPQLLDSVSHASTPALTPSPSVTSEMPPTPPPMTAPSSRIVSSVSLASSSTRPPTSEPAKAPELLDAVRPVFQRRPSHDLFECIEQSSHKRLTEAQARFVFAQVVDAVAYLDSQGVTHCDIKDENILVDDALNVKLIDFGSAVVVDPAEPRPHYTVFFGTTAYAASEVLLKRPYCAPPAEIWTLGVLLSYLLTGASPFPTERDAIRGRVVLHERDGPGTCVSDEAEDLMLRCLEPEPDERAEIADVRAHPWLRGAYDLPAHARKLS